MTTAETREREQHDWSELHYFLAKLVQDMTVRHFQYGDACIDSTGILSWIWPHSQLFDSVH